MAGRGDWVVTRENNRRMIVHGGRDWVKNGDAWQVLKRYRSGALRVEHLGHRGCVTLAAEYVSGQVQLMYATTAHRAQGTTVDTAHALITPEMSREGFYVTASRARERTTFYTATHDLLPVDEDHRLDATRTDPRSYAAREVLENVLAREGAELSATQTIRVAQDQSVSLAILVPRYTFAAQRLADRRYREIASEILGAHTGRLLVSDPAWGAVVRALHEAETAGWPPDQLLGTVVNRRELGTARSIAEVLAWRIDAHVSSSPSPAPGSPGAVSENAARPAASLPPWISPPPPHDGDDQITGYLNTMAEAISTRVRTLIGDADRSRPGWMNALGAAPTDTASRHQWLHHLASIAAYRDQYQVTSDNPRQVLGPYAEPGHAGHTAYWHAAASVLAARTVAGLEPADRTTSTGQARLAADVYLGLPSTERTAIGTVIAERLGPLWFGGPGGTDDHSATQPIYASQLTAVLAERGHLTAESSLQTRVADKESRAGQTAMVPVEVVLAKQRGTQMRPRHRSGPRAQLSGRKPPSPQAEDSSPLLRPRQNDQPRGPQPAP